MATTLTESKHDADFIVSEAPGYISREQVIVTVAAATTLLSGTVLGKLTATGKYVPYDNAGDDGSDVAAGVLRSALVNDGDAPADFDGVAMVRTCELRRAGLVWADGLVDNDKAAAYADLEPRGVTMRD